MKVNDICDGVIQCSDGSDEANCNQPNFTCPQDLQYSEFIYQCAKTKRCIQIDWLGDGLDDCGGASPSSIESHGGG